MTPFGICAPTRPILAKAFLPYNLALFDGPVLRRANLCPARLVGHRLINLLVKLANRKGLFLPHNLALVPDNLSEHCQNDGRKRLVVLQCAKNATTTNYVAETPARMPILP